MAGLKDKKADDKHARVLEKLFSVAADDDAEDADEEQEQDAGTSILLISLENSLTLQLQRSTPTSTTSPWAATTMLSSTLTTARTAARAKVQVETITMTNLVQQHIMSLYLRLLAYEGVHTCRICLSQISAALGIIRTASKIPGAGICICCQVGFPLRWQMDSSDVYGYIDLLALSRLCVEFNNKSNNIGRSSACEILVGPFPWTSVSVHSKLFLFGNFVGTVGSLWLCFQSLDHKYCYSRGSYKTH
jgi:hypothetical protein